MSSDKTVNLRLSGKNEDDLKVISAHLQDSVVLVKDIDFLFIPTFIYDVGWSSENFKKKIK